MSGLGSICDLGFPRHQKLTNETRFKAPIILSHQENLMCTVLSNLKQINRRIHMIQAIEVFLP